MSSAVEAPPPPRPLRPARMDTPLACQKHNETPAPAPEPGRRHSPANLQHRARRDAARTLSQTHRARARAPDASTVRWRSLRRPPLDVIIGVDAHLETAALDV